MLNSLRRSFGMSPSSSNFRANHDTANDVPSGALSPSNRPNTFIPLRRSNSFTNFFSSSRPSSPTKEIVEQDTTTRTTTAEPSSLAAADVDSEPVLAFLVLLDKKGSQKNRYPIQSLRTTMGRSPDNDVRFLVSDVSRLHCTIEIEIEQGQGANSTKAFLQVLGANGVRLNEIQAFPAPRGVGRYELHCGDSIVIAKRSFLFELPRPTAAAPSLFSSPVKGRTPSNVPPSPASTNKRRVRMSLVNAAQIDTPARPAAGKSCSPTKGSNVDREARRAQVLQRFMQSTNLSPSRANKKRARQSLTASASMANVFATPVKSRSAAVEPKTAPPKQVSFRLSSNLYSGRLSPVKQMRMMPPLDTMSEEQDGSFRSENGQQEGERVLQELGEADEEEPREDNPRDESSEDIVFVEELEQEVEQLNEAATAAECDLKATANESDRLVQGAENSESSENVAPSPPSSNAKSEGTPSKSASPKRAKRRSSFFGRAGPFRGINLGFYAEERTEVTPPSEVAGPHVSEQEAAAQQEVEQAETFSDASDIEPSPMEEEGLSSEVDASPIGQRASSKPLMLGISQTPAPVKTQHFVDLTPLPRRPRLSLTTLRRVSLRTQTLLRSSEAYADRLFLPPPPSTPAKAGPSGLSKSTSMPLALSSVAPPSAFDTSSFEPECGAGLDNEPNEPVREDEEFESQLDPALSESGAKQWKDSDDDEDEVDQSLSVFSPSPRKAPAYLFSPVKNSALPQFATPQPTSKTHARRLSMPPAGAADAKTSIRSALVRLQINGAGERIVHEASRAAEDRSIVEHSSSAKPRKVVRVSDVGLPATEVSMGFDLVQDSAGEHEPENIAEGLNDLFIAEEEELTDDEEPTEEDDAEEEEQREEIVQVTARVQESPLRASVANVTPLQPPQTPAALNSVRHLFSAASAAPGTPDMSGLASMLDTSPVKQLQYGVLGDRMRANPEIFELLSPSTRSPKKKVLLTPSPAKNRKSVRRSEAAEVVVPLPATPRALAAHPELPSPVVTPLPAPIEMAPTPPAFEVELQITTFDASSTVSETETAAQAPAEVDASTVQALSIEEEHQMLPTSKPLNEIQVEQEWDQEPVVLDEDGAVAPGETVEGATEPVKQRLSEHEPFEVKETPVTAAVPDGEAVAFTAVPETPRGENVMESAEGTEVASASPTKTRVSRRAASASPTKRTTRSASPLKRSIRSSPIKGAPAPAPEVFEQRAVERSTVQLPASALTEPETEPEPEPEQRSHETESPTKSTRRTGGRKAKQAATKAISASLAPEMPQASPEKPARRTKAVANKKFEVEEQRLEEEQVEEPEEEKQQAEEVTQEVEEEVPKRATRARATRVTAAKPVRSTRSRAATKKGGPALPSSSAGYGDDEASEEEEPAPTCRTKRAAATKQTESSPIKPTTSSRSTRTRATSAPRTRTTRSTREVAAVAEVESSETEEIVDGDNKQEREEEEEEELLKPKTRSRAPARSTRTKAATSTSTTSTASRGRSKAKAELETEEIVSSSSVSTATTTSRAGRPRRAAASGK